MFNIPLLKVGAKRPSRRPLFFSRRLMPLFNHPLYIPNVAVKRRCQPPLCNVAVEMSLVISFFCSFSFAAEGGDYPGQEAAPSRLGPRGGREGMRHVTLALFIVVCVSLHVKPHFLPFGGIQPTQSPLGADPSSSRNMFVQAL